MHWNHRVVKVEEDCYVFAEVFYNDETKKPYTWTDAFLTGETVADLKELVGRLNEALNAPVLDESEMTDKSKPNPEIERLLQQMGDDA